MKREIYFTTIFIFIFFIFSFFAIYKIKGIIENYENQQNYEINEKLKINFPNLVESGGIDVKSNFSFDIYINNELKGKSPIKLNNLKPGKYFIVAKYEGYIDFSCELEVKKGEFSVVNPILFSKDSSKVIGVNSLISSNEFFSFENSILAKSAILANNPKTDNFSLFKLKNESLLNKFISLSSTNKNSFIFQTVSTFNFDKNTNFSCLKQFSFKNNLTFLDKCNFKVYLTSETIDLNKFISSISNIETLGNNLLVQSNLYLYNFNLETKVMTLIHKLSLDEMYLGQISNYIVVEDSKQNAILYDSNSNDIIIKTSEISKNSFTWNDFIVSPSDNFSKFTNANGDISYISGKYSESLNPTYLESSSDNFLNLYFGNNKFAQVMKTNIANVSAVQFNDNFLLLDNFKAKTSSYIYFSTSLDNVYVLEYQDGYKSLFIIDGRLFLEKELNGNSEVFEVNFLN